MTTTYFFISALLATSVGIQPDAAPARAESPARDLGGEVRTIFAAKCAVCHGPDRVKPKGRFGYVLDLKRIAENPEMVIPGEPDQSELWELVKHGEMPQPESPRGPLSPEQKEVVRAWIAAGAPEPFAAAKVSPPAAADPQPQSQKTAPASEEPASIERSLRWLGKFHFLLIHFPIALVVAAVFGELWSIRQRNPIPSETVRFCVSLAALFAVPTATLGWIFAASGRGAGSPELLLAHRWLGTTAALLLVVTAAFVHRDTVRGARSRLTQLLLLSVALIIMLTAHLGGLMDRGADFFNY